MAQTLAACVRVTTKRSAVWRQCAGCAVTAPLARDTNHCPACRTSKPRQPHARR